MNKTELYKKNQKVCKRLRVWSPIVFWACIALSILCLSLAARNSIGNVAEIVDLLDSKQYNQIELANNYDYLVDKYGEWVIGAESGGFAILFINLKNAVFGGFAIMTAVFSAVFFVSAYLLGKWLLPHFAKEIEQDNQDMVNLTVLEGK